MAGSAQQTTTMINGEWVDRLSVTDRGLTYGDGLFETMRISNGAIPLLMRHLTRLELGCRRLQISLSIGAVKASIDSFLRSAPLETLAALKLIVTRGIGGQGYYPPNPVGTQPTVIIQSLPLSDDGELATGGVTLQVCTFRICGNPALAGIKHLNRLEYVLAAREVSGTPGVQGLLLDETGHILETLHHNLFVVVGGELVTPSLNRAGVKGVMRDLIIEIVAPQLGLAVSETDWPLDFLHQADEVFICNSLRGVWPVRQVSELTWKTPGAITQAIQQTVEAFWPAPPARRDL